jgi:hypothetical protein
MIQRVLYTLRIKYTCGYQAYKNLLTCDANKFSQTETLSPETNVTTLQEPRFPTSDHAKSIHGKFPLGADSKFVATVGIGAACGDVVGDVVASVGAEAADVETRYVDAADDGVTGVNVIGVTSVGVYLLDAEPTSAELTGEEVTSLCPMLFISIGAKVVTDDTVTADIGLVIVVFKGGLTDEDFRGGGIIRSALSISAVLVTGTSFSSLDQSPCLSASKARRCS